MTTLRNMGDFRVFLAESMESVRDGTLDANRAGQIAKLAAQINASILVEITARQHLNLEGSEPFNALTVVGPDGTMPDAEFEEEAEP